MPRGRTEVPPGTGPRARRETVLAPAALTLMHTDAQVHDLAAALRSLGAAVRYSEKYAALEINGGEALVRLGTSGVVSIEKPVGHLSKDALPQLFRPTHAEFGFAALAGEGSLTEVAVSVRLRRQDLAKHWRAALDKVAYLASQSHQLPVFQRPTVTAADLGEAGMPLEPTTPYVPDTRNHDGLRSLLASEWSARMHGGMLLVVQGRRGSGKLATVSNLAAEQGLAAILVNGSTPGEVAQNLRKLEARLRGQAALLVLPSIIGTPVTQAKDAWEPVGLISAQLSRDGVPMVMLTDLDAVPFRHATATYAMTDEQDAKVREIVAQHTGRKPESLPRPTQTKDPANPLYAIRRLKAGQIEVRADQPTSFEDLRRALRALGYQGNQAVVDRVLGSQVAYEQFGPEGALARPLCILFTGPSGVGKTMLATSLAEIRGHEPLVIPCSDEADSPALFIAKFVTGSAPGYVGYGDACTMDGTSPAGGTIVLDEIEELSQRGLRAMMGILDGRVTTSRQTLRLGRHHTVIATTNHAVDRLTCSPIGFRSKPNQEDLAGYYLEEKERQFPLKILSRFHVIVQFPGLDAGAGDAPLAELTTALTSLLARLQRDLGVEICCPVEAVARTFQQRHARELELLGRRHLLALLDDQVTRPVVVLAQAGVTRLQIDLDSAGQIRVGEDRVKPREVPWPRTEKNQEETVNTDR